MVMYFGIVYADRVKDADFWRLEIQKDKIKRQSLCSRRAQYHFKGVLITFETVNDFRRSAATLFGRMQLNSTFELISVS